MAGTTELHYAREGYSITTDQSKLDLPAIHRFLSQESYWSKNIPLAVVERSIKNSLCFGVFYKEQQVGFARIITDYATFAYLCDVYILADFRGRGLSKWLLQTILAHPDLQGLRRWVLATADAHQLYEQFGFTPLTSPERFMQLHNPHIYQPQSE